jgi:aminopeptidase N
LIVDSNPRQTGHGRDVAERAVDIVQYYESVVGDSPYPSFTVALIENLTPGGHSPGYFAAVNQVLPTSTVTWRNDPAAFHSYPEFFLAHEVAHQWWGQAVGWRNYHEQWLSEGISQYFAALYAEHFRGGEIFGNVMRQMRKWAIEQSGQGPVYLGYRIGHLHSDGRAFRAIVYNKGAVVLHMMRRLLGDEAFFRGIRRFYAGSRFQKVGTEDLRLAMEAEAGRPLERFFERWIYGATLPRITYSSRVENGAEGPVVVLRFEQTGDIFDLPVTVTLQYAEGRPVDVVVPIWDRVVEARLPLRGALRSVDISKDDGTLAEIGRTR